MGKITPVLVLFWPAPARDTWHTGTAVAKDRAEWFPTISEVTDNWLVAGDGCAHGVDEKETVADSHFKLLLLRRSLNHAN